MEHIAGYSSDVETTLTLNADGTYLLTQTFKEKQNERDKLRGTFQVLDGNILMLVHPSSDDNIFCKVRDVNSLILIDSYGNEPKKEDRMNYTQCLAITLITKHSLIYNQYFKSSLIAKL